MIVLTICPKSSASTWAQKMVAELLGHHSSSTYMRNIYADTLADIPALPDNEAHCHVIVKSHHPKPDLWMLAKAGGAKVMVTMRDPRDCIASLMQRFKDSYEVAVRAIESSLAHIDPVYASAGLVLKYEDGFTGRIETIQRICDLLGLPFDEAHAKGLIEKYSASEVKRLLDSIPNLPAHLVGKRAEGLAHRETGFFATHISDGQVGKYREVIGEERVAALDARMAYYLSKYGYAQETDGVIGAPCFSFGAKAPSMVDDHVFLQAEPNEEKCLVYGPYINLPSGNWIAEFLVKSPRARSRFQFDVTGNQEQLAMAKSETATKVKLQFTNYDPDREIEFRIHALGQQTRPQEILFQGVRISRQ